jgi:hypothetical protein
MAQSLASATIGGGVYNAWANVAAAQTDSVLVTAVPSRRIKVIGFIVNAKDAGAVTVTFNSKPAGAGVAITPTFIFPLNGGAVMSNSDEGYFETATGEGLTVTTAAASAAAVLVVYKLVK